MANRKEKGCALFYSRDSGGKHETTPSEYVRWAQRQAERLGLDFDGTPEAISAMIQDNRSNIGDLFFDYGVAGNVLDRAGLGALIKRVSDDSSVSHVLIPRRNRLARPNDATDGVNLENSLRKQGVTIVFMDMELPPLSQGQRQNIGELILATIDYDRSAEDRRELAQKVLHAQLHLAKAGFSTGGRPPYGFRRWLAKDDGTSVRKLKPGESVRMRGHHVVWLPDSEDELAIIRRIIKMLLHMPASQVARTLTKEGVPTPDHGRSRTDNGVTHQTSGVWHQSTIVNIARNPLLLAYVEYGRRSMGDQLRYTADGPRGLVDSDFRDDGDQPKVIRNPEGNRIITKAGFDPIVDPNQHRQLLAKLDARAGTQRGKARSRNPKMNPLGGRIFDMNCGWPLYRTPYGKGFRYKCGLYQQSSGGKCSSNHVDGPTATQFVLSTIRQRVLSPEFQQKLEQRIHQVCNVSDQGNRLEQEIAGKKAELSGVENLRDQATKNLARATSDEQYAAIAAIFEQHTEQAKRLETEIAAAESQLATAADTDGAVDTVMAILRRLPELARSGGDLGLAGELFKLLNAQLFLGFHPVTAKKRTLNKINRGILTLGDADPPIKLYEGPTARKKIKSPTATATGQGERRESLPPQSSIYSGEEDKSIGNVSRGEWI